MPSNRHVLYWDANVFLKYLNKEEGFYSVVRDLWDEVCGNEGSKIYTSIVSVVEVAKVRDEQRNYVAPDIADQLIDEMWKNPLVEVVDCSWPVARAARGLQRIAGINGWKGLKAPDAIHLATAQYLRSMGKMHVQEFNTCEVGTKFNMLKRFEEAIGMTICHPHVLQAKFDYT